MQNSCSQAPPIRKDTIGQSEYQHVILLLLFSSPMNLHEDTFCRSYALSVSWPVLRVFGDKPE